MKPYDYKDCVREKLLRRIPPSHDKAKGSMLAARRWLEEAERNLQHATLNSAVISAYLSLFHAARGILYRDGYREKSHYCLARYLEENYVKPGLLEKKWVEALDYYRGLRHDDQYAIEFSATKEEAEEIIAASKAFLEQMRTLLDRK